MKRILITGASGFIGSTLSDVALAKGWEVTAAVRPASDLAYLQDQRIRFLHLPFEDELALRRELEGAGRFDYVVHIAGTTKALRREDYFRTNADYTRRLVDILRTDAIRPERFLFLSSLAALGPGTDNDRLHPQRAPRPVTAYGASKLAAEQYLEGLPDFPWTVIQPTAVFGPRDKDILEFVRLVSKGFELYIGNKPQQVSFIYVKDLVSMMLAALQTGQTGRKYIATDGRDYTIDALGEATRTALRKRTLRIRVPMRLAYILATLSETIGKWRGKMPPLNREKLNEIAKVSWWCDMEQTHDELRFTPQYDLFSGMQETVAWYRANRWI